MSTPKPLRIRVDPRISDWPEIEEWRRKGHEVVLGPEMESFDLVLGPTAHRMSDGEHKWVGEAEVEARRRRYPK